MIWILTMSDNPEYCLLTPPTQNDVIEVLTTFEEHSQIGLWWGRDW
jgi:hypothetical protein